MEQKSRNILLILGLILVLILFSISLFKNIAYPFLWNDEADTAMFAKRILRYGYPKVHGSKNILNLLAHDDKQFAIKEKYDAFIGTTWGVYYFAAPGVFLAEKVSNLYLKTALLRIPFALIGFIGLFIMAFALLPVFNKKSQKIIFLTLFFFFELLSVALVLHLRDLRYHSLSIFLTACIFYLYFQFNFFKRMNFFLYIGLIAFLLILVFNTFFPLYFPLIITFGLDIILRKIIFTDKRDFRSLLRLLLLLFISSIAVFPFFIFFEILSLSQGMSQAYHFDFNTYFKHILYLLRFFRKYEFLYLALIAKGFLIILWQKAKKKQLNIEKKIQISNILSLFFITYVFFIARTPLLFERYFIVLQPILTTIFLLDIAVIFQLALKKTKRYILLFILLFLFNGLDRVHKIDPIQGHIYELFHQYKGPLDFVIPYIKNNFKNPEDLIIATNYEEFSFIYYLGSKIIVGQKGYNLEEDLKLTPDVIIQRKGWRGLYPEEFELLLKKAEYKTIAFPVYDSRVNNIPSLYYPIFHLFKTRLPEDVDEALEIYIKQ